VATRDDSSARAWAAALAEIAADTDPTVCVYLVVEPSAGAAATAVEPGGEVVGVAMGQRAEASPWPRTGEVSALYVLPGHQGRGLGRLLVWAVAAHLRERGLPALTIAVLAANTPARRFYQASTRHSRLVLSTGTKGWSRPKHAGPNTARASGVRIRAGVEMPTTTTRCP
jgi:ribosomal protein S18 acetylase RimI-like enzyme